LSQIDPAIPICRIGENRLVKHHCIRMAIMEDGIKRAFAGGVDDRDAHINRKDTRA